MKRDVCVVCSERPRVGMLFCKLCGRSYDRVVRRDSTIASIAIWAAERARRCEKRRAEANIESLSVALAPIEAMVASMLEEKPNERR
jgi:hypothetical protein